MDRELNIIGVLSTYDTILWTSKLHEPGTFKANFLFNEKMNRLLDLGNIVYKTDEVEAAVITKKYIKMSRYGEETILVQGYMTSRYLNQRIIWEKMIMRGTAEQIMRQMVYEQAADPLDKSRKIPRLEMEDFRGYGGEEIEKQITYDNLQEALTDLSKTSELGYRFRLDLTQRKYIFEIFQGKNRTAGTAEPCIFTRDFGNVYTQEYYEDSSNHRNLCLVGGMGQDEERILQVVGTAAGLDRYELFYNASNFSTKEITQEEYKNQLLQKGREKLASYYVAKAFESKINQEKAMKYSLGDYVTCSDDKWSVSVDTQIKEIEKGYSKEEKSVIVTFGEDAPTLVDLIKARG